MHAPLIHTMIINSGCRVKFMFVSLTTYLGATAAIVVHSIPFQHTNLRKQLLHDCKRMSQNERTEGHLSQIHRTNEEGTRISNSSPSHHPEKRQIPSWIYRASSLSRSRLSHREGQTQQLQHQTSRVARRHPQSWEQPVVQKATKLHLRKMLSCNGPGKMHQSCSFVRPWPSSDHDL